MDAVETLKMAMETFVGGVTKCRDSRISVSEAFAMIGIEIPIFVRPMLNQLSEKLPKQESESKDSVKV